MKKKIKQNSIVKLGAVCLGPWKELEGGFNRYIIILNHINI